MPVLWSMFILHPIHATCTTKCTHVSSTYVVTTNEQTRVWHGDVPTHYVGQRITSWTHLLDQDARFTTSEIRLPNQDAYRSTSGYLNAGCLTRLLNSNAWHESMIHFLNSDERCTTFENVRLWVLDVCDPPSEFRCPLNVHIHTHFISSVRLPMLQIREDSSMVELKGTTGQHTPQSPVLFCPVSAWLTIWHTDWVIL